MFGPEYIRAANDAAVLRGLIDRCSELDDYETAYDIMYEVQSEYVGDLIAEIGGPHEVLDVVREVEEVANLLHEKLMQWLFEGDFTEWPSEVVNTCIDKLGEQVLEWEKAWKAFREGQ